MKKSFILVLAALCCAHLTAYATPATESGFARCILEKMPHAKDTTAEKLVLMDCEHRKQWGSGTAADLLMAYDNSGACVAANTAAGADEFVRRYIAASCHVLFDNAATEAQ